MKWDAAQRVADVGIESTKARVAAVRVAALEAVAPIEEA